MVDSSASAVATLAAVAPALVVLSLPGDGRRLEVLERLGTPQLARVRVLVLADPDDARVVMQDQVDSHARLAKVLLLAKPVRCDELALRAVEMVER